MSLTDKDKHAVLDIVKHAHKYTSHYNTQSPGIFHPMHHILLPPSSIWVPFLQRCHGRKQHLSDSSYRQSKMDLWFMTPPPSHQPITILWQDCSFPSS